MNFDVHMPFVEHLGFVLTLFEAGKSEITYIPLPEHLNSFSVTHGGAAMTLLDVSMALAARSVMPEMGAVTVEMKTSFMQPACGDLRCEGRLIHRSATLAFAEATLYDAKNRICCHATGTFKYVKRLVSGSKEIHSLTPVA